MEESITDSAKEFERLFKRSDFLAVCRRFRWGKVELVIKEGKPTLLSVRRDIKLY